MNLILTLDHQIFLWIQANCHTARLDQVMIWIRIKSNWYWLYVLIGILLLLKYKIDGLKMILVAVVCVGISDLIGSKIIKPSFNRLRPCEEPAIALKFKPLVDCGHRGFSFTSNHASNHFALALSLSIFFYKRRKWIFWSGMIWAASISLAQVYVGIHYPLDIICGALIGIGIAWTVHQLISKYFSRHFIYR